MKIIKMLFISLICLFMIAGCNKKNEDGLDKYRKNGQLIDLDYKTFDKMLAEDESFVFFLKRNGCSSCAMFYPIVDEFLSENQNLKIYTLNHSKLGTTDEFTVAAYFIEALGNKYYEQNDYKTTTLYTPTICKIVNGEFEDVKIGVLDKIELGYMFQNNYLSLDTYYAYNNRVQDKLDFNIFVSKKSDKEYDKFLREYFAINLELNGYYLDISGFDDEDSEKLLNRINYYLGEKNIIEETPDYFMLKYENGVIVDYAPTMYDVSMLDSLYNK